MSKKKASQEDIAERLPGDLKEVAGLIGIEPTMLLVERYGGTYIHVPKCDDLLREVRNRKIRELYDLGKYDIRALAIKFRLTDRRISDILTGTDRELPLPLFELFERKTR